MGLTFEFENFGADDVLTVGDKWTVEASSGTGRDVTMTTATVNITGNTAFGRGAGFYLSDGEMDIRGTAADDINISKNSISTNATVGGEKRGGGFWVSGGGRGAVSGRGGRVSGR